MRLIINPVLMLAVSILLIGCKTLNKPFKAVEQTPVPMCHRIDLVAEVNQLPIVKGLPNPFLLNNGKALTSKKQWMCHRAEISSQAQAYQLGYKPSIPSQLRAHMQGDDLVVTVTDQGKTASFTAKVIYPKTGKPPYPAIIGMGGSWINNDELAKLGVAIIQFPNNEIAEQLNLGSRGKGMFYDVYGSDHSAGALMAWAWGVSRLIDALEATPASQINADQLGVTGCSRNGKGALVAGAFDERIKLTIAQESGSGGSASWRVSDDQKMSGQNVQTLAQIVTENVWFTEDFKRFSQSSNRLPYDQHSLMGIIAPRGLLLLENTSMEWLGNRSTYISALAAHEIWRGLGVGDNFGFSQLGGHKHCQLPVQQEPEVVAFVQRFLLDQTHVNTRVFKSDGNFALDKAAWINWSPVSVK